MTIKRQFLISLAMLVGIVVVLTLVTGKNSDTAAVPTPVKTVQPVEEIAPSVISKTLASKKIAYVPSANPDQNEAYCVHRYTDDSYVYQYIGQTSRSNPELSCS